MTGKKTVGQLALEAQATQEQVTAYDIQQEALKDHKKNIIKTVERDKNKYEGDFFVVVSPRREKILSNIVRNQIWTRSSCPTPQYDQHVYHYRAKDQELAFLWAIPDKQTAMLFKEHALELKPDQKPLLHDVLKFFDGTHYRQMKKLNGEHDGPGCGLKDKE